MTIYASMLCTVQHPETGQPIDCIAPLIYTDMYQLTMSLGWIDNDSAAEIGTSEAYLRNLKRDRMIISGVRRFYDTVMAGFNSTVLSSEVVGNTTQVLQHCFEQNGIATDYEEVFELVEYFVSTKPEVRAMPEGSYIFPNVPLIQITGNRIHRQVLETYALSCLNHGIGVASKALVIKNAASLLPVLEGGMRRTDPEASVWAAWSAHVGGIDGTSNVAAGIRFSLPTKGTMAHAWVMSFYEGLGKSSESELESFRVYIARFGVEKSILLVDTYDTLRSGVVNAIQAGGPGLLGIRLDSGDLSALSFEARKMLDAAGMQTTKIFASSGLDEHSILDIIAVGAPIDGVLVGERLTQVADIPVTGAVYKVVEEGHNPRCKHAENKPSYPFRKQVAICRDKNTGEMVFYLYRENGNGDTEEIPSEQYEVLQPAMLVNCESAATFDVVNQIITQPVRGSVVSAEITQAFEDSKEEPQSQNGE